MENVSVENPAMTYAKPMYIYGPGSTSYTYAFEHALHDKERNVFYLSDSNLYMCVHYDVGNGLFAAHNLCNR